MEIPPLTRPWFRRDATEEQATKRENTPFNRRRSPRRQALKYGTIIFRGGYCAISCQILDISDGGARLKPVDVMLCPGEFVLRPRLGPARDCEVAWRKGTMLGVRCL